MMLRELQEKEEAARIILFLQRSEKHYENIKTLFGAGVAANYSWNFAY